MAAPLLPTPPTGSARRFLVAWPVAVALLVLVGIPALDLLLLGAHSDPQTAWVEGVAARKQLAAKLARVELETRVSGHGRLLIAGGSSGLFSVDAESLEGRLGVPACNLATHAGLGLFWLLQDAREAAQPGDTVLLYLEYAHYVRKPLPLSPLERDALWSSHPTRLFRLPPAEALRQIFANPLEDYRQGWEQRNREMAPAPAADQALRPYSMVELGLRGDYRAGAPLDKPAPVFELRRLEPPKAEPAKLLDDFLSWCEKRKVQVIAARPAVVRDPRATSEQVERAYRVLEPFYEKRHVRLLDTRAVFQLPAELFYDTEYHANAAGRLLITEALAGVLAPMYGKPPATGDVLQLVARRNGDGASASTLGESRFVSAVDLHHPLCVTPAQVRDLCRERGDSGAHPVSFSDPEVGELLQGNGLAFSETAWGEFVQDFSTLDRWVRAFPEHLFLLAQVGEFNTELLDENVPPAFQRFLRASGPKCAVLGTGTYEQIAEVRLDPSAVELRATRRDGWQRPFRFPAEMALLSGAAMKKAPIFVERSALCTGHPRGLAVAVYDPARGTIVKQAVFVGPILREAGIRYVHLAQP